MQNPAFGGGLDGVAGQQYWTVPIEEGPDEADESGIGGSWTPVNTGQNPARSVPGNLGLFDAGGRFEMGMDLAVSLAELYFEKIHPLVPCLHRVKFTALLESPGRLSQPNALILIVLALACGEHQDHAIRRYAPLLYKRANYLVNTAITEGRYAVRNVQALTLMCTYLYFQGKLSEMWIALGKAYRMATALGLNRIDSHRGGGIAPTPKDEVEKEERRRVMWQLFYLDRVLGFTCGWGFVVDDRYFAVDFPQEDVAYQSSALSVSCASPKSLHL